MDLAHASGVYTPPKSYLINTKLQPSPRYTISHTHAVVEIMENVKLISKIKPAINFTWMTYDLVTSTMAIMVEQRKLLYHSS